MIIPFAGGCRHRERALEWVSAQYPWPVTVAPGGDPWCKAEALAPAVEASSAEILVVADADVYCGGVALAVRAVEAGAPWARPHGKVHRLTQTATEAFLRGEPLEGLPTTQKPYVGVSGGGLVVARRAALQAIPLDPRFVGWGQEDEAWGLALHTLAGRCWRGRAPLVHCWHPPQARRDRRWGSASSERLLRRYAAARRDPDRMRALLEEAMC